MKKSIYSFTLRRHNTISTDYGKMIITQYLKPITSNNKRYREAWMGFDQGQFLRKMYTGIKLKYQLSLWIASFSYLLKFFPIYYHWDLYQIMQNNINQKQEILNKNENKSATKDVSESNWKSNEVPVWSNSLYVRNTSCEVWEEHEFNKMGKRIDSIVDLENFEKKQEQLIKRSKKESLRKKIIAKEHPANKEINTLNNYNNINEAHCRRKADKPKKKLLWSRDDFENKNKNKTFTEIFKSNDTHNQKYRKNTLEFNIPSNEPPKHKNEKYLLHLKGSVHSNQNNVFNMQEKKFVDTNVMLFKRYEKLLMKKEKIMITQRVGDSFFGALSVRDEKKKKLMPINQRWELSSEKDNFIYQQTMNINKQKLQIKKPWDAITNYKMMCNSQSQRKIRWSSKNKKRLGWGDKKNTTMGSSTIENTGRESLLQNPWLKEQFEIHFNKWKNKNKGKLIVNYKQIKMNDMVLNKSKK